MTPQELRDFVNSDYGEWQYSWSLGHYRFRMAGYHKRDYIWPFHICGAYQWSNRPKGLMQELRSKYVRPKRRRVLKNVIACDLYGHKKSKCWKDQGRLVQYYSARSQVW